jgi:hypothetical protein
MFGPMTRTIFDASERKILLGCMTVTAYQTIDIQIKLIIKSMIYELNMEKSINIKETYNKISM